MKPDDAEQDHHLGGFLRRHLQQQHEQRRRPQRDAVDAGLRAGIAEPGDDQAARIFEQIEPVRLDDRSGVGRGRQRQGGGLHLQRPGERFARFLIAALAAQPARRFPAPRGEPAARAATAARRSQTTIANGRLPTKAPSTAPRPTPSGITQVTRPPTQPRLEEGMNSCTSGRSTQYRPPTPVPTKKRRIVR